MSTAGEPPPALVAPAATVADVARAPNTSRYTDANCDHVVLFPTGETHPRGTFFFTDYEIIGLNLGYAITDRLELEVTYFVPAIADVALKLNLHRSDWLRFAAIGAFDYLLGAGPLYRVGGVGQVCLSRECWSSISLNAVGMYSRTDLFQGSDYAAAFSAGAIVALSRVVKLLLEPVMLSAPGEGLPPELAWSGGVRFSGEIWGVDLGVIPGSQEFGPYLPWLSFTLRTRGDRPSP